MHDVTKKKKTSQAHNNLPNKVWSYDTVVFVYYIRIKYGNNLCVCAKLRDADASMYAMFFRARTSITKHAARWRVNNHTIKVAQPKRSTHFTLPHSTCWLMSRAQLVPAAAAASLTIPMFAVFFHELLLFRNEWKKQRGEGRSSNSYSYNIDVTAASSEHTHSLDNISGASKLSQSGTAFQKSAFAFSQVQYDGVCARGFVSVLFCVLWTARSSWVTSRNTVVFARTLLAHIPQHIPSIHCTCISKSLDKGEHAHSS